MCRIESEVIALRGEVVFIGAAIVGALLLNAFILTQIGNDLHCLKEMEKEKFKAQIPPDENELSTTTERVQVENPVKEQAPLKETKTENESKSEDEKQ